MVEVVAEELGPSVRWATTTTRATRSQDWYSVGRRGWDVEGGHAVWGWTGMTRTARESRSAT
jgi:hypothetical protein